MHKRLTLALLALLAPPAWAGNAATAQASPGEPVVVSTDAGDDIDDAFALALLLRSPDLDVRGIAASWGDTALRARLLERLVQAAGRPQLPLAIGTPTTSLVGFSQARWAQQAPPLPAGTPSAARMILHQARATPGRTTLLVLGPLTDAAAALEQDPAGFRQLARIVLMGGSVREGYGRSPNRPATPPAAEYNIAADVAAAHKVFAAGVPLQVYPLDATKLRLEDDAQVALFAHGDRLTDALGQLYWQWRDSDQPWASATPTLFDVVPVAALLDPALCPLVPMRLDIGADGMTVPADGPANASVCLQSDRPGILRLLLQRLLH